MQPLPTIAMSHGGKNASSPPGNRKHQHREKMLARQQLSAACYDFSEATGSREALAHKVLQECSVNSRRPHSRGGAEPDSETVKQIRKQAEEKAEKKWRKKFEEWQRPHGNPGYPPTAAGMNGAALPRASSGSSMMRTSSQPLLGGEASSGNMDGATQVQRAHEELGWALDEVATQREEFDRVVAHLTAERDAWREKAHQQKAKLQQALADKTAVLGKLKLMTDFLVELGIEQVELSIEEVHDQELASAASKIQANHRRRQASKAHGGLEELREAKSTSALESSPNKTRTPKSPSRMRSTGSMPSSPSGRKKGRTPKAQGRPAGGFFTEAPSAPASPTRERPSSQEQAASALAAPPAAAAAAPAADGGTPEPQAEPPSPSATAAAKQAAVPANEESTMEESVTFASTAQDVSKTSDAAAEMAPMQALEYDEPPPVAPPPPDEEALEEAAPPAAATEEVAAEETCPTPEPEPVELPGPPEEACESMESKLQELLETNRQKRAESDQQQQQQQQTPGVSRSASPSQRAARAGLVAAAADGSLKVALLRQRAGTALVDAGESGELKQKLEQLSHEESPKDNRVERDLDSADCVAEEAAAACAAEAVRSASKKAVDGMDGMHGLNRQGGGTDVMSCSSP
eukprot:TRINITY_DN2231_c0_g1_i3.p1 TRINITY_DN2231_c0_g1~~TRINITY_DN2231_c0_g1_i3.p1  ORF type:complete len:635 (+),score=205.61 TRINITY_DN2231_c0_g1_i3:101-2005(+)